MSQEEIRPYKLVGVDGALIGITDSWGPKGRTEAHYIYKGERMVDILKESGMDYDEAIFRVSAIEDAYTGPTSPIIMWGVTGEEDE